MREVSYGVKYIQKMGYLHRDLKPENIVMSFVILFLYRMFPKFVTLDGLHPILKYPFVSLIVELLFISHLR